MELFGIQVFGHSATDSATFYQNYICTMETIINKLGSMRKFLLHFEKLIQP